MQFKDRPWIHTQISKNKRAAKQNKSFSVSMVDGQSRNRGIWPTPLKIYFEMHFKNPLPVQTGLLQSEFSEEFGGSEDSLILGQFSLEEKIFMLPLAINCFFITVQVEQMGSANEFIISSCRLKPVLGPQRNESATRLFASHPTAKCDVQTLPHDTFTARKNWQRGFPFISEVPHSLPISPVCSYQKDLSCFWVKEILWDRRMPYETQAWRGTPSVLVRDVH